MDCAPLFATAASGAVSNIEGSLLFVAVSAVIFYFAAEIVERNSRLLGRDTSRELYRRSRSRRVRLFFMRAIAGIIGIAMSVNLVYNLVRLL